MVPPSLTLDKISMTASAFLNISLLNKLSSLPTTHLFQILSSILTSPNIKPHNKRCFERFATELAGRCTNCKHGLR